MDNDLTFGDVTDPYEDDDPDRPDGVHEMDENTDPGPMPTEILTGATVRDPSEHVEGYYGRAGGTFDPESGVLELVYVPYSVEETGGLEPKELVDQFALTDVRFVEVERLLGVLASLERFSTDDPISGEWWRAVLAEKLDAHKL